MADIAASNVTVTINSKRDDDSWRRNECTVAFGDGALTYPAGGIPLAKGKLGMARHINSVAITESNGDALLYEYDVSAETIRAFFPTQQTGGAGNRAGVEFTGGSTAPAATSLRLVAVGY